MNLCQALDWASQKLSEKTAENALFEAEIILAFVLKKPREFLFSHPEKELSFYQFFKFKRLIKKTLKGIPLAYLLKEREFYGRSFYVDKNVLIPRPETELLIDSIVDFESLIIGNQKCSIVDVGSGSGCIIISLAKILKEKFKKTAFDFFGLDISLPALKVAVKNAKKHSVENEIKFIKSNLLEGLINKKIDFNGLTFISANLPYLTKKQIKNSPSIQKEPRLALFGGENGLALYENLFSQIKNNPQLFKGDLVLFCEIDPDQKDGIIMLAKKYFPLAEIVVKKDLRAQDRLAIISLKF